MVIGSRSRLGEPASALGSGSARRLGGLGSAARRRALPASDGRARGSPPPRRPSASGRPSARRARQRAPRRRSTTGTSGGVASAVISAARPRRAVPRPQLGKAPRAAAQADSFRRSSPCTLLGCDVPAATTPSACGGRLMDRLGSVGSFLHGRFDDSGAPP